MVEVLVIDTDAPVRDAAADLKEASAQRSA
jgi:hypothetical protein